MQCAIIIHYGQVKFTTNSNRINEYIIVQRMTIILYCLFKISPQVQQQWPIGFTGLMQPNLWSQRFEATLHTWSKSCWVPHSHPVLSSQEVEVRVMDTSLSAEELLSSWSPMSDKRNSFNSCWPNVCNNITLIW